MAEINHCDACNSDFPTSRGLNIHLTRVHGEKDGRTTDSTLANEKIKQTLLKANPIKAANVFLRRLANRYGDPEIALTREEEDDLRACWQELSSEVDMGGSANKILPYLPYIAALFIAGPIILDKAERINAKGGLSQKPVEREKSKPSDGSTPTISRKDVMPDAETGD